MSTDRMAIAEIIKDNGKQGSRSLANAWAYVTQDAKAEHVAVRNAIDGGTFAAEAMNVAEMGHNDAPLYHAIISFGDHEDPSNEVLEEAADHLMNRLGFDQHQYGLAVHRDTKHTHVHVIANKTHRDTLAKHSPRRDYFTAAYALRAFEIEKGLTHDAGPYTVEYVGEEPHIIEAATRRAAYSKQALAYEYRTGDVSWQRWVAETRGDEVRHLIDQARDWADLHARLEAQGIEAVEVGSDARRGLVLRDVNAPDGPAAKASVLGTGYSLRSLESRFGEFVASARQLDEPRQLLDELLQTESTVSKRNVERVLEDRFADDERDAMWNRIHEIDDLVVLRDPAYTDDGERNPERDSYRYSLRAIVDAEQRTLDLADGLAQPAGGLAVTREAAKAAQVRRTMRDDQSAAFAAGVENNGLFLVRGRAGAGKSYTMGGIREAHEDSGRRVIGAAPTNAVAQDMRGDGFSDADTTSALLKKYKNGKLTLDANTTLIIDEAAMVSNRELGDLLEAAHARGARVGLVGDDDQLPAVGQAGLFRELAERHGAAEIGTITRQKTEWQRQAAQELASGQTSDALKRFEDAGHIAWQGTDADARQDLVRQYEHDVDDRPNRGRFVFAYTNDDVGALNRELRAVHRARGDLGDDVTIQTDHGSTVFAVGDRVQMTESQKSRGIYNGTLGTIMDLATDGTARIRFDGAESDIKVPLKKADDGKKTRRVSGIAHGYAGTLHRGQGKTIDETYLLHSKHWQMASGAAYVAMTRQKHDARIYASRESAQDWREIANQIQRAQAKRAAVAYEDIDATEVDERHERKPSAETATETEATASPDTVPAAHQVASRDEVPWLSSEDRKDDFRQLKTEYDQYRREMQSAHAAWHARVRRHREWREESRIVLKKRQTGQQHEIEARSDLTAPERNTLIEWMRGMHWQPERERLEAEIDADRAQIGQAPHPVDWTAWRAQRAQAGDARAIRLEIERETRSYDPDQRPARGSRAEYEGMRTLDLHDVARRYGYRDVTDTYEADLGDNTRIYEGPRGQHVAVYADERGHGYGYRSLDHAGDAGDTIAFVRTDHASGDVTAAPEAVRQALRPILDERHDATAHAGATAGTEQQSETTRGAEMDAELERLKGIDLNQLAEDAGYRRDPLESSPGSAKYRRNDAVLIVQQDDRGHGTGYFKPGDASAGSALDFAQNEMGAKTLGHARKVLRPYAGVETGEREQASQPDTHRGQTESPHPQAAQQKPTARADIEQQWHGLQNPEPTPFTRQRGITRESLDRYSGQLGINQLGTLAAAHRRAPSSDQVIGYELKSQTFEGFSKGGAKGAAFFGDAHRATRMVITESAIDALSEAEREGRRDDTLYASTGGAFGKSTQDVLAAAATEIDARTEEPEVVLAFDNDKQGHDYDQQARQLLDNGHRHIVDAMPQPGQDPNDRLRAEQPQQAKLTPAEQFQAFGTARETKHTQQLGISANTLAAYSDQLATDDKQNLVAAHRHQPGGKVLGYEMQNEHFDAFGRGGSKGAAILGDPDQADRLVVTDKASDALRIAEAEGWPSDTVYASTGGSMGRGAQSALEATAQQMENVGQQPRITLVLENSDHQQRARRTIERAGRTVESTTADALIFSLQNLDMQDQTQDRKLKMK